MAVQSMVFNPLTSGQSTEMKSKVLRAIATHDTLAHSGLEPLQLQHAQNVECKR